MIAPAPEGKPVSRVFLAQFNHRASSLIAGMFHAGLRAGRRTPGGLIRFVSYAAAEQVQDRHALMDLRTALLSDAAVAYASEVLSLASLSKEERAQLRQARRDRHPARVAALSRGHCNNSYF